MAVAIGAGIEQGADVIGFAQAGREHQEVHAGFLLDVKPQISRFDQRDEFLLGRFRDDKVRVAAGGKKGFEERRVIGGDSVGDQRDDAPRARRWRGMFAQQKPDLLSQAVTYRHLKGVARLRRPLQGGRKPFQDHLENRHVAAGERSRQEIAPGRGTGIEARERKKKLDGLPLTGRDGVVNRRPSLEVHEADASLAFHQRPQHFDVPLLRRDHEGCHSFLIGRLNRRAGID